MDWVRHQAALNMMRELDSGGQQNPWGDMAKSVKEMGATIKQSKEKGVAAAQANELHQAQLGKLGSETALNQEKLRQLSSDVFHSHTNPGETQVDRFAMAKAGAPREYGAPAAAPEVGAPAPVAPNDGMYDEMNRRDPYNMNGGM